MATEKAYKPRYPHSFHLDELGNSLVMETMAIGQYENKSDLFRDAIKCLNKSLKAEV